ncbi:MAG TPA: alkaline phosphatase family protein [Terriglobales bacterium]|nr:alkaline phosphatase family protein [Terriglobales bacterium]
MSLALAGCGGALASSPLVKVSDSQAPAPVLEFSVAPLSAAEGEPITLKWSAKHATSVTISPNLGTFGPEGTLTVTATQSVTYQAAAIGPGGETSASQAFSLSRSNKPARHPPTINPIKNIIFLYQENRSFDQYFSNMNAYRVSVGLPADVDVASPTATNPNFEGTAEVGRFHMVSMCTENVSPAWNESHVQIDRDYLIKPASQVTQSRMNGFVYTGAKYARDQVPQYFDTQGLRSMGYYDQADLPYYYFMATQFGISDRWFSPAPTRSAPNRVFTLAATSNGYIYDPLMGERKNIFQLLQENGISWKVYYTDVSGGIPVTFLTYFDAFYQANKSKVVPVSQYYTDVANGTLPSVAMIESGYANSRTDEHPGNSVQTGAAYVAGLINALMNSQSWKDSVFFLTYDESGGVYDHVPPPAAVHPDGIAPVDRPSTDIGGDFDRYGMRVPNLVISPYSKPGYVSHTVQDHTAILKFITTKFNLPSLTLRDNSQTNMYEFFDFQAPPRLTPPTPPAQPSNGPCYYDRLP